MGWLETGMGWLKAVKGSDLVKTVSSFVGKTGDYEGLKLTGKDSDKDTGFMAQTRDKFGLPPDAKPAGFTLLQKGLGRSAQGLTNIERILQPIHKLQANGYDALANALIQKAIKDNNLVSERDLLSDTVSTAESQNIKLGKVDI